MSRTEQFTLPRIPTAHARVTSPGALTHHSARTMRSGHHSTQTEPSYTAYVGTPRQDLPVHVFRDSAMYEGVFDKEGRFSKRTTPKYHAPLDTLDYNGLHDPHCRKLYLNNRHLREHLVNLGLLTEDLKVVASTKEQRQRIRAHEMLEKKEQLMEMMEDRERRRLNNMMKSSNLPHIAHWSHQRAADRQALADRRAQRQRQRQEQAKETANTAQEEVKLQQKLKWEKFVEEQELQQQRERNAKKLVQKDADMVKYINRFGMTKLGLELAGWHYHSHVIGQRMWAMEQLYWNKKRTDHLTPPPTDDADMADREGEGEGERRYLQQVEETARHLWRSREGTNNTDKQEEEIGTDSKLQKTLEPKGDDKVAASEVIADALLAVVGEGFSVQKGEGEGEESDETRPDKEKQADASQKEKKGSYSPVHSPVTSDQVAPAEEGEGLASQPPVGGAATQVPVQGEQRPTSEQSRQLLAEFVIMLAASADQTQMGYVTSNDFIQLLGSHDVGLKLTDDELHQVVSFLDPDSSGWVPYFESSTSIREILLAIYSARAVEKRPSSAGTEEAWLPMYTPMFGYLYFNSVDGRAQRERPAVFRPYLADDVFEDTIVDFFESADVKGDNRLDEDEFREFLFSPSVTEQLYEEQKEDLIALFSASTSTHMTLEEFVPLARTMITMVYRRYYEGQSTDEWLELNSNKFGAFWLNKNTGETLFPQEMQVLQSPGPIPSAGFTRQSSNQFGTDELPSLGEFTTARPSTYPHVHTVVPHATPMVYHTFAPPPASHQGERSKKKRLKKKQKSSVQEGEGGRPPPLRPRTKDYAREQRTTEGPSAPLDDKRTDEMAPQMKD